MRRLTDPVESVRAYVMVHGGIDKNERLEDMDWFRELVELNKKLVGFNADEKDLIDQIRDHLHELPVR